MSIWPFLLCGFTSMGWTSGAAAFQILWYVGFAWRLSRFGDRVLDGADQWNCPVYTQIEIDTVEIMVESSEQEALSTHFAASFTSKTGVREGTRRYTSWGWKAPRLQSTTNSSNHASGHGTVILLATSKVCLSEAKRQMHEVLSWPDQTEQAQYNCGSHKGIWWEYKKFKWGCCGVCWAFPKSAEVGSKLYRTGQSCVTTDPVLTEAQQQELVRTITLEEIHKALFDIGNDRALGSDGYGAKFFKAAWNTVSSDLQWAVHEFFYLRLPLKAMESYISCIGSQVGLEADIVLHSYLQSHLKNPGNTVGIFYG